MQSTLMLVTGIAAIVVAVGLFQIAVLGFRNPLRPDWLKNDLVESLTVVGFTALMALVLANEIAVLVIAGANTFVAIAMAPVLQIVVGYVMWRAVRMNERLRQADHGQSPFRLASKEVSPMHGAQTAT